MNRAEILAKEWALTPERIKQRVDGELTLLGFEVSAYLAGYRQAIEDAAKRCERSAAGWAPLRSMTATNRRDEATELAEAVRKLADEAGDV